MLLYSALVPLVGVLITLMNSVNSRFASLVGTLVATLVIHIVGLVAVSVILVFKRETATQGSPRFFYYLGGLVGIGTVFCNNFAYAALGASLAVALSLLGQTLFSMTVDSTGLLGRKRYPFSSRRLPGLGLAFAGIVVMAGDWRSNIPAMLVALAAGALPGLSFILNSELAQRKGVFHSTRMNYLVGLAGTLAIVALERPLLAQAARAVAGAGPLLAISGGLMGLVVVSSMNFIFPRVAAFSATLLLFCGQALAGILIDFALAGSFDMRRLGGVAVLLAGLAIDSLMTRKARSLGKKLNAADAAEGT